MKKLKIIFVLVASFIAFSYPNDANSSLQCYEMVSERCSGGGFQKRCRWNDAASCDVSAQTSCEGGGPIQ
jgi:hypothetical protein